MIRPRWGHSSHCKERVERNPESFRVLRTGRSTKRGNVRATLQLLFRLFLIDESSEHGCITSPLGQDGCSGQVRRRYLLKHY